MNKLTTQLLFCSNPKFTAKVNSEYIASGLWQCPLSPTGSHHWLLPETGNGDTPTKAVAHCRYCWHTRTMLVNYDDAVEPKKQGRRHSKGSRLYVERTRIKI